MQGNELIKIEKTERPTKMQKNCAAYKNAKTTVRSTEMQKGSVNE
jgi:hypothetical protein